MAQEKNEIARRMTNGNRSGMTAEQKRGWLHFAIFAVLIVLGILVKRMFHRGDLIMMFHVPAAIFLVLAGYKIPAQLRERYRKDVETVQGP